MIHRTWIEKRNGQRVLCSEEGGTIRYKYLPNVSFDVNSAFKLEEKSKRLTKKLNFLENESNELSEVEATLFKYGSPEEEDVGGTLRRIPANIRLEKLIKELTPNHPRTAIFK